MPENVTARREQQVIPTYIPKEPNAMPMFFEKKPYQGASGRLYPLPYSDGITDEKKDVSYEVYTLENEYIQTQVLPAIGGKILSGYDKIGHYDLSTATGSSSPHWWVWPAHGSSGASSSNWPQHHPPHHLPASGGVSGRKSRRQQDSVDRRGGPLLSDEGHGRYHRGTGPQLHQGKNSVYNRTNLPQIFMWWANLAVAVNESYRTIFPPDVEWVNDHDRRAVLQWPIAKGVYKSARPFDYGDGTDLSLYDSVKVPSSFLISQGQSDMDFVAGYDGGLQKALPPSPTTTLPPARKCGHGDHGDFGEMWCSNLTDEDGPYIELMTGVYTDNQPDLHGSPPLRPRSLSSTGIPSGISAMMKNATIDAAMNLEQRGEMVFLGFNVTGSFPNARITVRKGEEVLFTETADMTPAASWCKELALNEDAANLTATLTDENGSVLVSYKPTSGDRSSPSRFAPPVKRPASMTPWRSCTSTASIWSSTSSTTLTPATTIWKR